MSRPSRSTTRLVVPAHPEFFQALRHSLRFHLRLFAIPRPAALYALAALEEALARTGASTHRREKVRLTLKASERTLRIVVRLPAASRLSRLAGRLPETPDGITLHVGKPAGDAVTLVAAIPGRD